MAALTWRNVDAPDFRPSMEGYQTFSRLLDNAFGGLQQGLGRYDRSISDRVNTALQLKIAGAQDADAAKALTANLANDPNAARISAATIDMATARPNALITQALNQENLGWTQYGHGRVKGFDTAEDAAAPLVMARQAAYASGKGAEWDAANPGFGTGLSLAARTSMFDQGQKAQMTGLDITGKGITNEGGRIQNKQSAFNLETGEWRFGNEKLDRNRSEMVNNYLSKYAASGGALDPNFVNSDPDFAKLDGTSQMLIRSQLGGMGGGGGSGGMPGSGGGGGAGGDPMGTMNYQARAAGFTSVPQNVQTLGQASDFALEVNRAGVPSSAMGIYQIVGQTLRGDSKHMGYGEKVFGKSWREQNFRDPAVQDQLAEAIFNDNRGSAQALKNQWVSLTPQMAERVRKMPWTEARQYIAQGESGANPAGLLIGQTLANQGQKNQFMQGNANSIAEPIQAAMTDTSSLVDVASGLTGDKGALKGANRSWVMQQIQRIQAMGNGGRNAVQISPAAAAQILSRSTEARGGWDKFWSGDGSMSKDAISGDLKFNSDSAKSFVDQLRTGDYQKQVVTNQTINLRSQQVQSTEQAWQQARQRLQAAQQQARGNPRFDQRVLGSLTIAEATAAANYQAAIGAAGTSAQMAGGMGRSAAPPAIPAPPAPVAARRPIQNGNPAGRPLTRADRRSVIDGRLAGFAPPVAGPIQNSRKPDPAVVQRLWEEALRR